jgi:sialate O-acetylesterase
MSHIRTLLVPVLLVSASLLRADVVPAALFTDNAVLQRDKPVPVWGTADAGEKVSVSFAGQSVETTANTSGKWMVKLAALPARSEGSDLVIKGRNTLAFTNVVVGEVWIASGQSNMEWVVKNTYDASIDIPASVRNPLIRHLKIKCTVGSAPADSVKIERGHWEVSDPATTGEFTAVGYYFAKDIHALTGVPVGIIGCNWGGSAIEAWVPPSAYLAAPDVAAKVKARWDQALADYPAKKAAFETDHQVWLDQRTLAKAAGQPFKKREPRAPWGPGHRDTPAGLFKGMINPLVPYALRGAIWYQGEANASRADEYRGLFNSLITGWRAEFGQGDFPFYWVQLANHGTGTAWAFLREAQTQTLALPHTGQAVIVDIGNVTDIHPRNKKDVGRRLARLALKNDYGFIDLVAGGPVLSEAKRDGSGFRVSFTQTDGGLVTPLNELAGFELAGADKVFKPARARLSGGIVIVTSAEVPDPAAVRYDWCDAPVASLFNKDGLPAVPFRTDNW